MRKLLVFTTLAFGISTAFAGNIELAAALNKIVKEEVSFCRLDTQGRSASGVPVNITCDGQEFFAASVAGDDNEPKIMTAISASFLQNGFKVLSCEAQEVQGIGGSTYKSGNICFFYK